MKVCFASARMLWTPTLGGHTWVNLNWLLGLEANGVEVVVLETFADEEELESGLQKLAALRAQIAALGSRASVVVVLSAAQRERFLEAKATLGDLDEVVASADLLLGISYAMDDAVVARFRRSALVDIDPGLLQMWLSQGAFQIPTYDCYFTIGETVGVRGSLVPDTGHDWIYTPPPVHLEAWPVCAAGADAAFTTVTNWWANYEVHAGESFNNEKRTSFMQYLRLPERTSVPLELAVHHEEGDWTEIPKLREHGWRARPASEVSATPMAYHDYIGASLGEFSCAKPSCMRFQNAWISDRTICYLASGKPAVVQHTGPSSFLPEDAGLLRFRSLEEAATMLERARNGYAEQCSAARALAEQHFAAEPVVARVLERALAS